MKHHTVSRALHNSQKDAIELLFIIIHQRPQNIELLFIIAALRNPQKPSIVRVVSLYSGLIQ